MYSALAGVSMKTRKSVLFIITSGMTLLVICCVGTVGCFIGFRNAAAQETKSNNSGAEQFLRALSEARAKSNAGEWKDAAALWEKVVRLNPVTGEFWYRLGEARYKSADYRNAIPAYEQALRLGVVGFPSSRARDIARCHALMGEKEQALKSLEKAFAIGYRRFDLIRDDPAFQSLRMEPRFQALVAAIDTSRMSRTEGWRYDLQLLAREVKRRRYDPFRSISEADFDGAVKKIHDSIPHLTDMRITIEMMRLLARVRDGHTLIFGIAERPEFRRNIPVDLSFFEEGLFITAAEGKHEDLLGARVLRFGERTVEEVLSVMDTILSRDNERAYLMAGIRLRNLPILHGLGLIPEADKLLLTVSDIQGKVRTITLTADSDIPSRRLWDQLPDGWKSFHQTLGGQPPLYLKNIYADYWFEYLPEAKTVYFQFNHVRNNEQEPLARFCERLFGFIGEREVEKLVIDMRWAIPPSCTR